MTAPKERSVAEEEALVMELCARYIEARRSVNQAIADDRSAPMIMVRYEVACMLADELCQYDDAVHRS